MSDDKYRLTEEGVQEAMEILERDGYLPEATDEEDINTLRLKAACTKYIEDSKAKGDGRSEREKRDGMLVAFFDTYLQALVRRIVN